MLRKTLLTVAAALLVGVTPAALAQQRHTVDAGDNLFEPQDLQVQAGDTVVFENVGALPHTATAEDGTFDSGNLDPGQSFEVMFEAEGTFPYICEYHEVLGMVGTIVVGEGGGEPATPEPTQAPEEEEGNGEVGEDVAAPEMEGDEQRRVGPVVVAVGGLLAAIALAGSSLMRGVG